ncbi:methyl-accepting chemotaxis protein [Cohnella luojiensis]|nr:methyl-accepting chemotaxis protein [Cohnella luojiensis]
MKKPRKNLFRFTISRKLFAGFTAVLLILVATVALGYFQISKVESQYTAIAEDQANHLFLLQKLELNVKKEQSSLRGYLLLDDAAIMQEYNDAHSEYKKLSSSLEESISDHKAVAMLQEAVSLENNYYFISNKAIRLKVGGNMDEAMKTTSNQGQEILTKFEQKAEELSDYQKTLLDQENQAVHKEVEFIKLLIILAGSAAVVVSLVITWFIGRIISRPIVTLVQTASRIAEGDLASQIINIRNNDEVGDLSASFNEMSHHLRQLIQHVSSSAEQVAASSEQLTATSEQASLASGQIAETMQQVATDAGYGFQHLEEASKTIGEMSAGVQHIANRTHMVSNTANVAFERALEGDIAVRTAIEQMSSIHDTVAGLSVQINGLGERSAQIGNILNSISDIASKTNILSLNAGIEAARSGEYGKGFLVIASEIRKLAEQSSHSAEQIAHLVEAIQAETQRAVIMMGTATKEVSIGIEAVHSASSSFEQIKGSVTAVNDEIQEVSTSIRQMAAGADHIVGAMKAVTLVSETTVSGAQEVSASTEEQLSSMEEVSASAKALSRLAEQLQTQIDRFRL